MIDFQFPIAWKLLEIFNISTCLQRAAKPNEIIIGEKTKFLISNNFGFRHIGRESVREVAARIGIFQVKSKMARK